MRLVCWILLFVLLFFFTQKTAYEMRISDWSSDVCSSDLEWQGGRPCGAEGRRVVGERGAYRRRRRLRLSGAGARAHGIAGQGGEERDRRRRHPPLAPLRPGRLPRRPPRRAGAGRPPGRQQIGRAPCGERVGRFVYISVVQVAQQKKKKK